MVIMHLAMMMNQFEELEQDLMRQVSGDSASAGDDQSPGTTRGIGGCMRPERPVKVIPCPRCQSMNTKFCYYNNYSVNQPRHFCRNCQRYWTVGGTLRNVPVGGGSRKKVRTRQRNDGQALSHDPRRGLSGSGLLNMTIQSNLLQLPNTMQQMVATQQELSSLLQATGGNRLGSYDNQFLQSGGISGLMQELPTSNTGTSQSLPGSFFQFSNMDQQRGQNPAYNTTEASTVVTKTAPAVSLMNHQDHTGALSMLYDLQSNHAASVPNSSLLQMGNNNNHGSSGIFSNGLGFNHPQVTMDHPGNHIEFLSSVMHKPAYWGA